MEKLMNKMDNMEMDKVAGGTSFPHHLALVAMTVMQILWQQM
ncbi:hypothetical protein [Selenomonas sp. AE3005]|nr:hypothetical protein [Selenomonas sp. AE3005]